MKVYFSLILLFTITTISFGQELKFVNAKITYNNGSTSNLKIELDHSFHYIIKSKIPYKKSDEKLGYLSPITTKEIEVNNERHITSLQIDDKFIFSEYLVESSKSLLVTNNHKEGLQFFVKTEDDLILLSNPNKLSSKIDKNLYKQQLIYVLRDCKTLLSKIENSEYTIQDLVQIFQKYNECIGKETIGDYTSKRQVKSKGVLGIGVGVHYTKLTSPTVFLPSPTGEIGFNASLNYSLFPNIDSGRLILRLEATYSKEKSSSDETFRYTSLNKEQVHSQAKAELFSVGGFGGFILAKDLKIKPYIGFGVAIQFLLNNPDEAFTLTTEDNTVLPTFNVFPFAPLEIQKNGPKSGVVYIFEGGSYFPIQGRLVNLGLGVKLGSLKESALTLVASTTYYFKVSYPIF